MRVERERRIYARIGSSAGGQDQVTSRPVDEGELLARGGSRPAASARDNELTGGPGAILVTGARSIVLSERTELGDDLLADHPNLLAQIG
jgi:hypothetical protein